MKITAGLVEQHIHGAFGIDFMTCTADELLIVSKALFNCGVTAFFPTIMTDELNIIKRQINVVKQAKEKQTYDMAQIIGVHLEGPFINPEKAGIHEKKYILPLNIDLYKQIEDEIIKIVTIAPELDNNNIFSQYLRNRGIKVSAGHCTANDLSNAEQVTHLYNAMGAFSHRDNSTVVNALADENIYAELIADSMHINDKVLKLTFKMKSSDKILLISDALPLAHSDKKEHTFAGQKIYNRNGKPVNKDNVFAGSSMLLCDIIKNLTDNNILKFEEAVKCASSNQLKYHNIKNNIKVFWNDDNIIENIELSK